MSSDKYARLTFNHTAERKFFGAAKGLRVKIEHGGLYFHPSIDGGHMKFVPSDQLGRMADVDSAESNSRNLMQILQNSGYSTREPFFVLCDASKGWVSIEHYPFDKAPPNTVPHFRVWPLRWAPDTNSRNSSFDLKTWRNARALVLRACTTIKDYEANPHRGRPPRAVTQAREVMGSLHQLLAKLARITDKKEPHIVHSSLVASNIANMEQKRKRA